MVAASDILYKEEVLHILDHTPVWVFDKAGRVVDGRKKQLMDLRGGMPYTYMLENFFPELALQPLGGLLPETRTARKSHFPKRDESERAGTGPATR